MTSTLNDAEMRSLERLCSKDNLSEANVGTLTILGLAAAAEIRELRAALAASQQRLAEVERERDSARTRIAELLVTVKNLSLSTPYPEESRNAATLIAEVGTLKAEVATMKRGYVDLHQMLPEPRSADVWTKVDTMKKQLAASQQETERLRTCMRWVSKQLLDQHHGLEQLQRANLLAGIEQAYPGVFNEPAKEGGVEP